LSGERADEARNLKVPCHHGHSPEDEAIGRLKAQALLADLIPQLSRFERRVCMLRFVEERSRAVEQSIRNHLQPVGI
jgi:hypothetical protein